MNGKMLRQFDKYSLYEMNAANYQKYYMCLPNEETFDLQMVIDFPEKEINDISDATERDNRKITEIEKVCNSLYGSKINYIYLLPDVTTYDFKEATTDNDDRAYMQLMNEIRTYTTSAKAYLESAKNVKILDFMGIYVETDDDQKLLNWLLTYWPDSFFDAKKESSRSFNFNLDDDTGWTTKGGPNNGGETLDNTQSMSKPKVKRLVPPNPHHGFMNITFGIGLFIMSIILGIIFGSLLMK